MMKIDMHCHVKEGSLDSRVGLEEYISLLKEKGFQGMVVTDHNTYNGYRKWKYELKEKLGEEFVVLKGIEYDTRDAGHILVIMPEGLRMRLLELRGLPVAALIDFVHRHGGVLGPAHPGGEKYLSFAHTKGYFKAPELAKRFDFFEVFNACESAESNAEALRMAQKYNKPGIGGSDAHRPDCVGMAYTELPEAVTCETELIAQIRNRVSIKAGGEFYTKTTKDKMGKANKLLTYSFWFYNQGGAMLRYYSRNQKHRLENPIDPVDPIETIAKKRRKHYQS